MKKKRFNYWKTKDGIALIVCLLLGVIGIACVGYATVMQMVLCYEKYGVVINSDALFFPHKSAWFYLGALGFIPIFIWAKD